MTGVQTCALPISRVATLRVALLAAAGVDGEQVREVKEVLCAAGALADVVGARIGAVATRDGSPLAVAVSFETAPSVVFDGVVVADGDEGALAGDVAALEFLKLQHRHLKPMLALGCGAAVLQAAGIPVALPDGQPDPGVIVAGGGDVEAALASFHAALAQHRIYARETDPPRV